MIVKKNAWVAAILNFLTIGLGYVYVGKRPLLGVLLTLGAGGLLRYEELRIAPAVTGVLYPHWIVAFVAMALVGVATGIDGYREAKGAS